MQLTHTNSHPSQDYFSDGQFAFTVGEMQKRFDAIMATGKPIFVTDADDLWDVYLEAFSPSHRQYHNCNCCKNFIRSYGSLATVNEDGSLEPVMWNKGPNNLNDYAVITTLLHNRVRRAKIVREFTNDRRLKVFGTPQAGGFSHFAVKTDRIRYVSRLNTPAGERAGILRRALAVFSVELLDEALRVLEADAVNRADKFVAPVRWLRDLHAVKHNTNLFWNAVAAAPEGFCHPRGSVIGTLLEDIASGLYEFEEVRRRFNAMMHPLQYQRPQAAPSMGTILQANKLFEAMGLTRSLARRFARIEDVELAWRPQVEEIQQQAAGGAFDHLLPKTGVKKMALPATLMTWEKFAATVLPTAKKIEMHVPHQGNFCALTTAVHQDAPPLFKWGTHTAWFVIHGGSSAQHWSLYPGEFVEVTGIYDQPEGYIGHVLLLRGARPARANKTGNALFPECMKGELHQVRSAIEAYSRGALLYEGEQATAVGYQIGKGVRGEILRVDGRDYKIDRWA